MKKRISDILAEGQKILQEAGIEDCSLDAWYLLEWAAGITRAVYYAHPEKEDVYKRQPFLVIMYRRGERIPVCPDQKSVLLHVSVLHAYLQPGSPGEHFRR